MKILIAYYSMTGNTELIAKSMYEALTDQQVTLKRIEDIDPSTLNSYNLLLIGSGIYAGRFHKSVKKILKEASGLPPKGVLFYTHATQDPETYQPFPRDIRKILEASSCKICGEFECLGEQKVAEEELVQRLQKLSPEERKKVEESIAILKNHPNKQDLNNAKEFVKSLI
jgi:flavodoxin